MPNVSRQALLDRVLEAIRLSGCAAMMIGQSHPYDLLVTCGATQRRLSVYIWNVSHGGGYARPSDEYRIQITGVPVPLGAPGSPTLLLGWDERLGVFAAFDPERHRQPGPSPSIQIREETLEIAKERGFAVARRGNQEIVASMRPEFMGSYIQVQGDVHRGTSDAIFVEALERVTRGEAPTPAQRAVLTPERKRVTRVISQMYRDASFRRRVLTAYRNACAVCGSQLELVEAAHIVPVDFPGSTDETCNGIALCPTHHAAYDRGLLGIEGDFRIEVREDRLIELADSGLGRGAPGHLRRFVGKRIRVPASAADRPSFDYLETGLRARGWPMG